MKELRPHKWSDDFPHDGGYCIFDLDLQKQTGWARDKGRAEELIAEENRLDLEHPPVGDEFADPVHRSR